MKHYKHLFALAALATTLGSAYAQYVPTYTINNNQNGAIYDMVEFWQDPQGGGIGSLDGSPEPGFNVAGHTTQTIMDLDKPRLPSGLFIMGLYTETEQDPMPGQDHLVLFMNQHAGALSTGVPFETLFPSIQEDTLIQDLHTISSGTFNPSQDFFNFIFNASHNIPDGGSQSGTSSAWIQPAASNTPSPGVIEMFSNGQVIGDFSATVQAQAVPEPCSLAVIGLGLAGLVAKRKKIS